MGSGDLVRQMIAEAGDTLEMPVKRAGYINDDGTVTERVGRVTR